MWKKLSGIQYHAYFVHNFPVYKSLEKGALKFKAYCLIKDRLLLFYIWSKKQCLSYGICITFALILKNKTDQDIKIEKFGVASVNKIITSN